MEYIFTKNNVRNIWNLTIFFGCLSWFSLDDMTLKCLASLVSYFLFSSVDFGFTQLLAILIYNYLHCVRSRADTYVFHGDSFSWAWLIKGHIIITCIMLGAADIFFHYTVYCVSLAFHEHGLKRALVKGGQWMIPKLPTHL